MIHQIEMLRLRLLLATLVLANISYVCEGRRLEELLEDTSELVQEIRRELDFEKRSECVDKNPNCTSIKERSGDMWNNFCTKNEHLKEMCEKTCGCNDSSNTVDNGGSDNSGSTNTGDGNVGNSEETESGEYTETSHTSNVTAVEECTDGNKGHCKCANTSEAFQTYVLQVDGQTRCFTVYHSDNFNSPLPIMLSSQCYAEDRLSGILMMNDRAEDNAAAKRYGYARVALSTPDGHWTFGNDGVVNDDKPMPCSENDSKDIVYLNAIFNFIETHSNWFDSSRIWAEGFSQNSMFSAYIGFCFSDKVLGIWQGGSGMALTGEAPNLPGCQGQCKASVFAESSSCNQCKENTPCTECQYWPIYPCYSKRPVVDCLADYVNDYIASDRNNAYTKSTAQNMKNSLIDEGHDARLFRFNVSSDGTIPGGHQNPKNKVYWQVGCLGITEPCSKSCEEKFVECVRDETLRFNDEVPTGQGDVDAFETCIEESKFESLGCSITCAPTYRMLAESETPVIAEFDNFGANDVQNISPPQSSKCQVD